MRARRASLTCRQGTGLPYTRPLRESTGALAGTTGPPGPLDDHSSPCFSRQLTLRLGLHSPLGGTTRRGCLRRTNYPPPFLVTRQRAYIYSAQVWYGIALACMRAHVASEAESAVGWWHLALQWASGAPRPTSAELLPGSSINPASKNIPTWRVRAMHPPPIMPAQEHTAEVPTPVLLHNQQDGIVLHPQRALATRLS
ncbi:hypothetical protein HDV57DRAFT_60878 [Trichoderma longibrachiatum]|uniref:Uncharacterized protein n=1 Tax=Trichoderma longibrachiatum ATCC 18648 TaxID=983965 RepID=A0A2T4CEX2_TRILO|nr:hypothetical protein M440DRAFT_1111463 [Trichoderma longibrachiatum ATCC 18648]